MSFTHLQVKSGYSLMNSTITIEKLVKRASQLQYNALALTDENVLYGVIPFYKLCRQYDIKPIIGMTVTVINQDETRENCVLLAKTNLGYQQLMKLSTDIQTNQLEGIEKEKLHLYREDVICILPVETSKLKTLLPTVSYDQVESYMQSWESIYPHDDLYIGIQKNGQEHEYQVHTALKAYHEIYPRKVVAIHDVRYLKEQDAYAYDCLQAMGHGEKWKPQEPNPAISQLHLRSQDEMQQAFGDFWPEVLVETDAIKEKCHVEFDFDKRMIPSYPVPENKSAHQYLEEICWQNIQKRYEEITDEVKERLSYELGVIESMQFSDYFLIVWDFIKYAKENKIVVGPGRGSSAGSIVAYVLQITDVDPLKYDLLFERFLNPERITMPDIDIDFSDQRRDEVISYVREKYGQEQVAQIITFGTFAARSLLRELIKTLEIDQQDEYFILKEIPAQSSKTLTEHIKDSTELSNYIKQSNQLKTLFQIAIVLEGIPRHVSTHAAGVVISEQSLVNHVPLTIGSHDTRLTQFSMTDLESIGLLKIDFLGLRNLTLIERIIQSIHFTSKNKLNLEDIPEHDLDTFSLLKKGKTNGVFQLESEGMKQVLTRLQPSRFEDIVAVNALYRPGPMDFIPVYIKRKQGLEKTTYPHPDLEPILKPTYGVLVYQEQIMQIANRIAGYSLGEADILRRAVSKKQQIIMDQQREQFINGCLRNGYTQKVSEELFAWIVKFSNYGFPKSHAVAYSKIAYQLAYLKTHYPKSFYAELMSSVANQQDKIHSYMNEMKQLGLELLPPSINKSYGKFAVEPKGIRMGLMSIKGIGNQAVKEIIQVRKDGPFKNLFDFCLRVSNKLINRATLELLILAGAFDETYKNRASLLASIDQAMEQGELFREFTDQPSLFENELELEANYIDIEDFSPIKKLADEKELMGIYLSSHPLKQYRSKLRENGFISINRAFDLVGKKNTNTVVIIQSIKVIRTKRGDQMAFLVIGDETGEMDAVIFPDLYREVKKWLNEEAIAVLNGKVEERNGKKQWVIQQAEQFEENKLVKVQKERLFIKITDETNDVALSFIKKVASSYPGSTPVIIYHAEKRQTYKLAADYSLEPNYACLKQLYEFFGREQVVLQKIE
ncbi:DNA polymerase III subunit alpha [Ornithinibacillus halophilus]|uniref:DNA polymerase III subunit alpha n=1 Tax=Ornithinibacillus halophilus TaxID=930117 RepID=A0A1M5EH73_9BACI|nr:DNA polymerase III subunit alpha [Ornithinibacillus halophilus]SHF78411.1 DNA polymerase-3 subunit alpha [Ornithinibacillus halophilus]